MNAHVRVLARRVLGAWLSRHAFFLALALAAQVWTWREIQLRAHGPSMAFDDVFIHFRYAQTLAEGHPFRYGGLADPPSSGATSVLYAAVLAVFHAVGFRGMDLAPVALLLGAVGWWACAEGLLRLGTLAWSPAAGWAAAMMVFASGMHVTAAGTGMETVLAAAVVVWVFALSLEAEPGRGLQHPRALAILAALAPWVRTEMLSLAALGAGAVFLGTRGRRRAMALVPVAGALALLLFWRLLTGTHETAGAVTKSIFLQPYETRDTIRTHLTGALRGMRDVLDGLELGERYFPHHGFALVAAGWGLVELRLLAARRWLPALAWLGVAVYPVVPAGVVLWHIHRGRYYLPALTVPMACAFVALVAAGSLVAKAVGLRRRRRPPAGIDTAFAAAALALLALRVPEAVADTADCARQIREQQILLATESVRTLPPDARVLLNDAGAIRYFGGHDTVDLVGLTTRATMGAFPAGTGSVFEALESLPSSARPTHAAVYRAWLGHDELFSFVLARRAVWDQSILGGPVMELLALDTRLYGSGEAPLVPPEPGERVVDVLDVADLASERRHGHALRGADRVGNLVRTYSQDDGRRVADGGRVVSGTERFTLEAVPGRDLRLVLRTDAWFDTRLHVTWNGVVVPGPWALGAVNPHRFVEVSRTIEGVHVRAQNDVAITVRPPDANFGAFHWFALQRDR